jgi:hypothetical protein
MPSMLTSVAKSVRQISVVDWPAVIVLGLAVRDAVGAGAGGGGGGGGGGAVFFLHALTVRHTASAMATRVH